MSKRPLAYEEKGEGPALVLIHGHPFDRGMWSPQLAALGRSHRVIAPDLRGYGRSPVTAGKVPMRVLADDVAGLLDSLGVDRAAFLGLSMGGLVAMELALAHPGRTVALVLAATTADPATDAERAERRAVADRIEADGMLSVAAHMIERLFGPRGRRDVSLTTRVFEQMVRTPEAGAAAALRGRAERPNYLELLPKVAVPSLVIAGDADPYAPPDVVERLVNALPGARAVTLRGAGHLPNLEAPEAFNDAVLRFLSAVGSAAT